MQFVNDRMCLATHDTRHTVYEDNIQ